MNNLLKLESILKNNKYKRILIYGTGKNAERLINAIDSVEIVGILDHTRMDGSFCGYPILCWEDVNNGMVDAIVIAASNTFIEEIFVRIMYRCKVLEIQIYDIDGRNLFENYSCEALYNGRFPYQDNKYYWKNFEELKTKINDYDAVSFDLFDTLIARKVLEPIDVFDIVQARLESSSKNITEFKKKRRTAELEIGYGNIDVIYENMSTLYKLDKGLCQNAKKEELKCEQELLIQRCKMVELMDYAYDSGKIVSIISDMYLPAKILKPWLDRLGIKKYHNIFVSCDYGCGKTTDLFKIYKEKVGNKKYIHIGDNVNADVMAPLTFGIESYDIKSGYEMLCMSNMRNMRIYENDKCGRQLLGLVVSELFNNPFALSGACGYVRVDSVELFVRNCIAPLVYIYMSKLGAYLQENSFDGVLLSSRDGCIFKKIIDENVMQGFKDTNLCYFLTSRKAAWTATIKDENDWDEFKEYSNLDDRESAEKYFEIKHHDYSFEKIIENSNLKKERYIKYIEKSGLLLDENYLLCDLVSSGTVHYRLNKLFNSKLQGFYLYRVPINIWRNIDVYSALNDDEKEYNDKILKCNNILEKIITSDAPSIAEFDEDGKPIFDEEDRDKKEIQMVNNAHRTIIEWIKEYINHNKTYDSINEDLAVSLFCSCKDIIFEKEASIFNEIQLRDDITGKKLALIR